ncbi:Yip1-domain-containing protein [Cryphonectria parasitica EP155]|uniref:Yip1-domain-containing protein n=1 Tax=Cryphonectria parasitica (strain ATCC 38755 / EP155) TaxID=660469 RepID=A0A9P5CLD1_CRYP1|nr:Yip1-domain-containing protein [Cryphonectria parasitica EP155]KAF3761705.1 Yip1-domain-containing protein [Cryphonectria parasitica EP155]
MAQYGYGAQPQGNPAYAPQSAQNLQFYPSSYGAPNDVSGHAASSQSSYGYGAPSGTMGGGGANFGFGPAAGVSGRMGEQGGLRTGWLAAFSAEGYEGEPSLLEELDINFGHIQAKTIAVLNPFRRIDQHLMDDSDIIGPLIFLVCFGFLLALSGTLHFGYVYGLSLMGSTSLHVIISLMTPQDDADPGNPSPAGATPYAGASSPQPPSSQHGHHHHANELSATLTWSRSASVLGYCIIPLLAMSVVGVFMPMDTPMGIVMTSAAIMWCTYSASGMFCAVGRLRSMRGLVAYPLALFYVGFGIMTIFSSRGSGNMAKIVGSAGTS